MVNRKSINIVLALLAAMVAFIILFDFVKTVREGTWRILTSLMSGFEGGSFRYDIQ